MKADITVAILAGGKSSRFGSPKPLAPLGHYRLIDYAIDRAKQITSTVLIITNELIPGIPKGIRQIPDYFRDMGPLSGIHTALSESSTAWTAVFPIDTPFVPASFFTTMGVYRDSYDIVVPCHNGKIEPLLSLWRRSLRKIIAQSLRTGRWSIKEFILDQNHFLWDCTAIIRNVFPPPFFNINTVADAELAHHWLKAFNIVR